MAAPDNTSWGDIVGGYGRIGISVTLKNTNTETEVTLSTWFWSKYSVSDSNNSYYYNNNATSATKEIGSINIKTTVATGGGWSTSNQVKLGESTFSYDRGTKDQTISCAIKLTDVDRVGGTMTHKTSYTIPALAKYTVKYDANGGSGAPASQTKYYGIGLTISTTKPTRTGYTFKGWSLEKGGSVYYTSGSTCGKNENLTIYAVWEKNALTVNYYSNYATESFDGSLNAVGAGKNVLVRTASDYYDNGCPNGLWDYSYEDASTYLARTGYTATGYWGTSPSGGTLVKEDQSFDKVQDMAAALGKDISNGNASINLYAQWQVNTYAVKFNANGGSGSPADQTKTYGTDLTLSTTKPKRTGYTFQGWGTSANDTTVDYAAGGIYTANKAITLYAIWKANTYTLTLDPNGGTVSQSSFTLTYNSKDYYGIASWIPERKGYTFLGWYTAASGGTQVYNASGVCTNEGTYWKDNKCVYAGSYTLYAHWQIIKYKVSFHANGGSGAPAEQEKTHGTPLTLSGTKPTRTGYTFLGWSTSSTATSAAYASGGSYTSDSAVTLYAVWKQNLLEVNYYSNNADYGTFQGGELNVKEGSSILVHTQIIHYDNAYSNGLANVQNSSYLYLSRTGYTPTGKWGTSASGGTLVDQNTQFATGQAFAQALGKDLSNGDASVNVYVQWQINSYKLTVDPNGGTWNGSTGSQEFTQNFNTTKSIPAPTWTGHTFSGWTLSGHGSISDTVYTFGAGAGTLTAQWDTNLYSLSLNPNGGTINGSAGIHKITEEYGTGVTLPNPSRAGYTFKGWSSTSTGSVLHGPGSSITIEKDSTLYAIWTINSYTLTVDPNGGTWNGSADIREFTQNFNTTKAIPVPTRTGYTFDGWTLTGAGTIESLKAVATTYTFNAGNGTLTAKWIVNEYSVTFNARENLGWFGDPADFVGQAIRDFDYGTALGTLPESVKKNYTFIGWFTAPTGGTQITGSYVVTKDVTFYAQYAIDASAYAKDEGTWKAGVVFSRDEKGNMKKGHVKVNDEDVWKDAFCN